MYRKDQLVFYGNTGVCRVADVAPLPQQKDDRLYYTPVSYTHLTLPTIYSV